MLTENLVSKCYVIHEKFGTTKYVYPTVYLVMPLLNDPSKGIQEFDNVFTAKKYIELMSIIPVVISISRTQPPADLQFILCT